MDSSVPHESMVTDFCGLTGVTPSTAQSYLDANHWDLSNAVTEYYTAQEEGTLQEADEAEDAVPEVPDNYTGPRTLDGRPAPESSQAAASSSRSARQPARGGFATIDSMNSGADPHAGHGHGPHDDYDDDDEKDPDYEDEEEPRNLFAGGEKSGLAVQDPKTVRKEPKQVMDSIIRKAQKLAKERSEQRSGPDPPSRFRGSGMTLGGDGAPSQPVPETNNPQTRSQTRPDGRAPEQRTLHVWSNGFSVDDGPLYRFDDPANAAVLNQIRQGSVPRGLMNLLPGAAVDVTLSKHEGEYVRPPKVYKPFGGVGNRLGSPTPGEPSVTTSTPMAQPVSATTPSTPEVVIDQSQPTLMLRIQLANGTRLPARFNTSHTVGDVYDFISQASPELMTRPWVLATTFPNKDHTDRSIVLGEASEFKKGGMAIQKWT